MFFELYDEDTEGWRPAPLSEVAGPQERVLRHIVEQIVDLAWRSWSSSGAGDRSEYPRAHVVEGASRARVPLMVFLSVDVPKITLSQYDFQQEM